MATRITKIGWIRSFFEKKRPKSLPVPKKALPLHPQSREMPPFGVRNAEIAQLVEHNLAKVGVAGPSPVFRSLVEQKRDIREWPSCNTAQVAELVDAHVSGACAARRAGSSPVLGTLFYSAFVGEVAELVDALL